MKIYKNKNRNYESSIICRVTPSVTNIEDIIAAEFDSSTYRKCKNVGKAVIVSNFMEGYTEERRLGIRRYAEKDCDLLEKALTELGFEPWDGKDSKMVYKNLTKKVFTVLYNKGNMINNIKQLNLKYFIINESSSQLMLFWRSVKMHRIKKQLTTSELVITVKYYLDNMTIISHLTNVVKKLVVIINELLIKL